MSISAPCIPSWRARACTHCYFAVFPQFFLATSYDKSRIAGGETQRAADIFL
jgi:hypothetical protein